MLARVSTVGHLEAPRPCWRQADRSAAMVHAMSSQVAFQARDHSAALDNAHRAIVIDPQFWIGDVIGTGVRTPGQRGPRHGRSRCLRRGSRAATARRSRSRVTFAHESHRLMPPRDVLKMLHTAARERYVPPFAIALVHAGLREDNAIFRVARAGSRRARCPHGVPHGRLAMGSVPRRSAFHVLDCEVWVRRQRRWPECRPAARLRAGSCFSRSFPTQGRASAADIRFMRADSHVGSSWTRQRNTKPRTNQEGSTAPDWAEQPPHTVPTAADVPSGDRSRQLKHREVPSQAALLTACHVPNSGLIGPGDIGDRTSTSQV